LPIIKIKRWFVLILFIFYPNPNPNPNPILVTMDVVSLYTNTPHDEAVKYISEQYENTLHLWNKYNTNLSPVPVDILNNLLSFCLSNCEFCFDNKYFKQNYGLLMGAPAAVRVANIFMYKHFTKFINNYNRSVPQFFGRLIDDIFFTWQHTEQELLELHSNLNSAHKTVKFELTYSTDKINFLDVTLHKKDNVLHTTLYIKPSDKKEYLYYTSNHPTHCKQAIPYSQAVRYRRIVDEEKELIEQLQLLENKFIKRKFPRNIVRKQINKAQNLTRNETLRYKTDTDKRENFLKFTDNKPFLSLIITYDNRYNINKKILNLMKTQWSTFIAKSEKNTQYLCK